MKVIKTASGNNRIKISKKEWTSIGKKAGWMEDVSDEPSDSEKSIDYDDLAWELNQLRVAWRNPINKNDAKNIVDDLGFYKEDLLEELLEEDFGLNYGDARQVIRFVKYYINELK